MFYRTSKEIKYDMGAFPPRDVLSQVKPLQESVAVNVLNSGRFIFIASRLLQRK